MTGAGDLTATIQGRLNATVDMTGSGDLTANMTGFANLVVDLLGAGDLDATIAAFGDMSIDIVVTGTGLTTANVAQAVWSAVAAANNDSGTMGAKLNSAASGGVDLNALADAVWDHADAVSVSTKLALLEKILRNKSITDPATGEFVLYDDNGVTELFRVPLWQDADGTVPYQGQGAERKERLE